MSKHKVGFAKVNSAKNCQPHQRIFELVDLWQYERYSNNSFTNLPSTSHTIRICNRSKPSSSPTFLDKHLLLSMTVQAFYWPTLSTPNLHSGTRCFPLEKLASANGKPASASAYRRSSAHARFLLSIFFSACL